MQQASIQRSNTEQEILQVVEEYRSEVTRATGQSVRRVLIVMCNGGALLGRDTLAKIEEASLRDGIMVYPIDAAHRPISGTTGLGDISHQNADLSATINGLMETSRASFRDWAEKTGGIYFEVDNSSEIKKALSEISDGLKAQFALTYVPTNNVTDGKFHNVQIEIHTKGVRVQAPRGYYAPQE
jgi:VWFA-related protein